MNNIKGVIFDMDGILLDSESISDITWERAGKDFNIPMTIRILDKCRGSNKHDIIETLKNEFGQDFDANAFLAKTGEYYWQIEEENGISLMPYVKEILEYLQPHYRLALASSTGGISVAKQLTKTQIISYFDKRITGDMVTHSKPDPEIYLKACEIVGLKPEECVAIEDSPNGIRSAAAAGLTAIMVPDRIKPDEELKKLCFKVIPSLKGLEEIL